LEEVPVAPPDAAPPLPLPELDFLFPWLPHADVNCWRRLLKARGIDGELGTDLGLKNESSRICFTR
jgi:hypothetical protein